jgi:uncharacterized iron-regulated protein
MYTLLKHILLFTIILVAITSHAQKTIAYKIYNAKGKEVSVEKMVKQLGKNDVVLFGELHNDPIGHWLQLKVSQQLHQQQPIILGAEMFERDNQVGLNAYLSGETDRKGLDRSVPLWSNISTHYAHLLDFAKAHKLPFIATNIPRRYASMLYRHGIDTLLQLSDDEKQWIAPLPFPYDPELPGYKAMMQMMPDHANENFPKAQAIKDATMAASILKARTKHNNDLFLHFNGAYHSNNYEGIYWYLKKYYETTNPGIKLNIITISTVLQSNVNRLAKENKGIADFILVVDEEMTTTY